MKKILLTLTLLLVSINSFSHEPANVTEDTNTVKYWILETDI